jgi:predicted aldo/keto reductase-like oxidoreductase
MAQNERYSSEFEEVLRICRQRNVAVQTIKSTARGPWATTSPTHNTWYQPLTEQADIDLAVHWVLSRPEVFLNTAGDLELLPKVLDAASRFDGQQPCPAANEMQAMLEGQAMTTLFGIGT